MKKSLYKNNRQNTYWFLYKFKGTYFFYNSITRDLKKASEYSIDLGMPKVRDGIFSQLNLDDCLKYKLSLGRESKIISEYFSNKRMSLQNIFLMASLDCNQSCTYCLCRNQPYPNIRFMRRDIALKSVDLLADNYDRKKDTWQQITFYGGEPLLNKKVVLETIEYARKIQKNGFLSKNLAIVLNTNGLLLNDSLIRFFKKYNVEIQLSFDGIPKIHDKTRILKDGSGSSKRLKDIIELISRLNGEIVPQVTVTDKNMDYLLSSLKWLSKKVKFTKFSLNLVMYGTTKNPQRDFVKKAFPNIISSIKWAHNVGISTNIDEIISEFLGKGVILPTCGATTSKITVFPEGTIGACQSLGINKFNIIGKLPKIFPEKRKVWFRVDPLMRDHCLTCAAISICGGGCLRSAYNRYGDIGQYDIYHCQFIRSFLKWLITNKIYLKENQGVPNNNWITP